MSAETSGNTEEAPKELALGDRGDPARTRPADNVFRCWHHLVSAAADPRHTDRFDYWSRHTSGNFAPGDFIFCEPADRSWWALKRVLEVCGEGCVVEGVVASLTMRYQVPPPKPGLRGTNADDFAIERSEEFVGKFVVVRLYDKHPMTKGQPFTREQCAHWLSQYLKTVLK
jgi:hypothetical protein